MMFHSNVEDYNDDV